jgi:hypothetical protein
MEERMRNATVARIGRSYPRAERPAAQEGAKPPERRFASRYGVLAGVLALVLALVLTGWLLAAYRPV